MRRKENIFIGFLVVLLIYCLANLVFYLINGDVPWAIFWLILCLVNATNLGVMIGLRV